jgi:hypothetical protein
LKGLQTHGNVTANVEGMLEALIHSARRNLDRERCYLNFLKMDFRFFVGMLRAAE